MYSQFMMHGQKNIKLFITVCQKIKIYKHSPTILAPSIYALNYFEKNGNCGRNILSIRRALFLSVSSISNILRSPNM